MGGRGGSGGAGGGGSRGTIKFTNLPELSGSPKQVSWANDIRDQAAESLNTIMRNAQKKFPDGGQIDPDISEKAVQQVAKEVQFMFSKATSAKRIIDNRGGFTFNSLDKIVRERERQRKRKIAWPKIPK